MKSKNYFLRLISISFLGVILATIACKDDKSPLPTFAVQFDGINGHVIVENSLGLNPSDAITISMWVRLESAINCDVNNNQRALIIKEFTEPFRPIGYNIRVNCDRALEWRIGTEGGLTLYGTGEGIQVNKWTFLTFTYESTSSEASIYMNSIRDNSGGYDPNQIGSGSIVLSDSDLSLNLPNSEDHPAIVNFPGSVDDLSIWNIALDSDQISNIMTNGIAGTESGLISYWSFNEGADTTAFDTISENDGTLQDGVSWIEY